MVIYFTGTGNSKFIAERIADALGDNLVNSFNNIKSGTFEEYNSEKPYVFVCPTYAWRIPRVFEGFIKSSSFKGSNNAYFVMTCGGETGNAGHYLKKLCEECSLNFKGIGEVIMPENYTAMFAVPKQSEADKIIEKAIPQADKIIEIIKSGNDIPYGTGGITGKILSAVVNPAFYPLCVKSKAFKANDKCISCGKCEALCPLNNIKLTNGKPAWADNCTHCMACINACPEKAIEYGKASIGKPRYYNLKSK